METEKERDGFDRRQFLRRAAVAGAAAAWTAPVVKSIIGTPAFATNVTGSPKDLSYVAVFYTSDGQAGAVKWDLDTGVPESRQLQHAGMRRFLGRASTGDPSTSSVLSGSGVFDDRLSHASRDRRGMQHQVWRCEMRQLANPPPTRACR